MKRLISISLMLIAVLLLCSCGNKQNREPETQTTAIAATAAPTTKRTGETFTFTTTDMNGNTVSSSDLADKKVIMINMWETWCGPCVNEMPDLQQLYLKYKDQGFVILGVTTSLPSDVSDTVSRLGVTYPILNRNAQFDRFVTGYVPTTFFLDGEGHVLSRDSYVGGRSGSEWERILLNYMQG